MTNGSPPPSASLAGLSPLQLAVLARQVREQSAAVLRADPIAIVGMGCRLPGGVQGPEDFWRLLHDGVDAVREQPPGRWDVASVYDPDPAAPGKASTRSGGFLDEIDGFDAAFFGILPREANAMDPQQRLFLEVAIEALDHAGLPRERLAGSRTGVFVASYYNDYAHLAYSDPESIDARTLTGTVHSVLANRLSYLLDLRGPSVSVDTACSSSLVAIHLACQSLRHGESDVAIAGGVSLMVAEGVMIALSKVGFMAPDGRCKTFDARADGFGRGEGCSVLVLKRLADAVADGDRVLALVRGSAVNQDGHSTVLAAPNGLAQQALIREALANAQIDASRIGYVEAHGTGTALGDPIEVEALAATVGRPAPGAPPCLIGAAKANIGHLEAAAGATGVVKSVLMLRHGEIPPQVHFRSLNPHIELAGTRLQVPDRLMPWPAGAQPRCIGTSGFGVGGTNAHIVLEEAPALPATSLEPTAAAQLLPLSARSPAALRALAQRWIDFLPATQADLASLCASAGERRSHDAHRFAAVGSTADELCLRLRAFVDGAAARGWAQGRLPSAAPARLAFVYGGQGQQWVGMGRELLETEPVFRDSLQDIDARLRRHAGWSLVDELRAPPERSRLAETEVAQPAIFALQVALTALWASWGFRPDGVVGHSIGEIAALHVAGVLELDDAVRIVVQRARVMQRATGHGAMASVGLTEAEALDLLRPYGARLSLAAANSPRGVVLSGQPDALAEALRELDKRGVAHRALPVNYAFHSAQMAPLAEELVASLGDCRVAAPRLPFYSTVDGARLDRIAPGAAYFGRNVREPVRFAAAVSAMVGDGFDAFLEIGAHPVLAASIAECSADQDPPPVLLASLRRERSERESLLEACAGLYCAVRTPDWQGLNGPAEVLDLPAYPWQHERFWLRARPATTHRVAAPPTMHGRRLAGSGDPVFEATWPGEAPDWLRDHRIGGRLLVPGTALLDALRGAATDVLGPGPLELRDFVVLRPLPLDESDGTRTTWQVAVHPAGAQRVELVLRTRSPAAGADAAWETVASATGARPGTDVAMADAAAPPTDTEPGTESLYEAFAHMGVEFGPAFRTLEGLSCRDGSVRARLNPDIPGRTEDGNLHPAVLDGALQACVAAAGGGSPRERLLPIAVDRLRLAQVPAGTLFLEAGWRRSEGRTLQADLRLSDAGGRLVAQLDGVRFVPAGDDALGASAAPADDWLHEIVWQPAAMPDAQPGEAAAWLLLCDAAGVGDALADALEALGHRCLRVRAGAAAGPDGQRRATVDPRSPSALDTLFADASWRDGRPLSGVVHLWSLDSGATLDAAPVAALHTVQAMVRASGSPAPLVIVTRSAQPAGAAMPEPGAAGLWGLGSVIAVEHPELMLRLLDLDADAPLDVGTLAAELCRGPAGPRRLAWRGGRALVPRLQRMPARRPQPPQRLTVGAGRTLDDLRWMPAAARAPGPGEVRLRVAAAGLNFRDVLLALGMVEVDDPSLGAECAGIVEAVGAGVAHLHEGDRVYGFAPGGLAGALTLPASHLTRWDERIGSLDVAAAQPAAYLTAMLGLLRLGGLHAGHRLLIHAATGGVGLAAVRIAQRAGAEIFATAGSPAKRAQLQAMGVAHVFDSRSLAFADEIRAVTGGAGVDMVLNSLAGDFIGASVGVLADTGCFLELGKRGVWTAAQFQALRPRGRYHVYDLGEMAARDPQGLQGLLAQLHEALADGSLEPLPVRVFDAEHAVDAMRLMAQARHTGKLVLRFAGPRQEGPLVRPDAAYWITGGLGALGLHAARWLARSGARHLVLSGRHPPGPAAQDAIRDCTALGATIHVRVADAGDAHAMRGVCEEFGRGLPPLRGVIHAAGSLEDGVLLKQDAARFARVLHSKAQGARLLDALTARMALDFFVVYSAVGHLLGPAGQGPYATANAELDALALRRRALGRPALSVAWGLWRDGGMAATMAAQGHDAWSARGLGWIEAEPGLARLERLLREGAAHAVVLPIDWARFLERLPAGVDPGFFPAPARPTGAPKASAQASPAVAWGALPPSQRASAVQAHVAQQALQVLGLSPATPLDARQPLKEVGLDSLMAVELRNALARSIGCPLPATLLFDHPSLQALTRFLLRQLKLVDEAQRSAPDAPAPAAPDEVAALSEAEAETQLLAELDAARRTP